MADWSKQEMSYVNLPRWAKAPSPNAFYVRLSYLVKVGKRHFPLAFATSRTLQSLLLSNATGLNMKSN